MSGQDLMRDLQAKITLLDSALKTLSTRGKERAEKERAYRVALAQTMLTEREKGVAVSMLGDVCKGQKEIAELKLHRDIADAMYDAAKEACNVYKLEIRVLEEAIEREWRSQ